MTNRCKICANDRKTEIDRALIANQSFRHIASRFDVSTTSLQRHKKNHLPKFLLRSNEMKEMAGASTLANEIESLRKRAKKIASKAESAGDYRTALQGVRELTRITELCAKLCGELNESPVNVTINSQWIEIRSKILSALDRFPEAKIALSKVLRDVTE